MRAEPREPGFQLTPEQEHEAAGRSRVLPLFVILAVQAAFLLVAYGLAGGNAPRARIYAFDTVALPGETVNLTVNISQDIPPLLSQDETEYQIVLSGPGLDDDGVDVLSAPNHPVTFGVVAPKEAGVHEYRVELVSTTDPDSKLSENVYVQVIPPERPIILTTVRQTLTGGVTLRDGEAPGGPNPRLGAKKTLDRLAGDHAVIYLEHRPPSDLPWAARWIRKHQLPAGAVLLTRRSDRPYDEPLKSRMLALLRQEIASRWKNVRHAFGSDDRETSTFSAAGIPTVYIGASAASPIAAPVGGAPIKPAQSWARVDDIVK